jgi:hypothetical protein
MPSHPYQVRLICAVSQRDGGPCMRACPRARVLQHSANRAHALLKEANIDFTRTMNKIVFDLHLQHAAAEGLMPLVSALPKRYVTLSPLCPCTPVILSPFHPVSLCPCAPVPALLLLCPALALPLLLHWPAVPPCWALRVHAAPGFVRVPARVRMWSCACVCACCVCRVTPPVPEVGVLTIPRHDFAQDFSDFSFQSHLTKLEVITAIQKIMAENQKVLKGTLLSTAVSKSARLDEFEQTQNTTIAAFAAMLKDHWSTAVCHAPPSSACPPTPPPPSCPCHAPVCALRWGHAW